MRTGAAAEICVLNIMPICTMRYQTYVRNYGDNKIHRIACGPNVDDYHWMEVLMREATRYMDSITLHYYTIPGPAWEQKGQLPDLK